MPHRFKKHYTRDEARALLPSLRRWLEDLATSTAIIREAEQQMTAMFAQADAIGGEKVNRWARAMAKAQAIFRKFEARSIQIKDLDRGLVDFPAFVAGREAFLCWEKDEEDIEFWHDIDTGYEGRERLEES